MHNQYLERASWSHWKSPKGEKNGEKKEKKKIRSDLMLKKGQKVCLWPQNYMGTCSQAPHATPGQRQMGTYIGKCVWATRIPL